MYQWIVEYWGLTMKSSIFFVTGFQFLFLLVLMSVSIGVILKVNPDLLYSKTWTPFLFFGLDAVFLALSVGCWRIYVRIRNKSLKLQEKILISVWDRRIK